MQDRINSVVDRFKDRKDGITSEGHQWTPELQAETLKDVAVEDVEDEDLDIPDLLTLFYELTARPSDFNIREVLHHVDTGDLAKNLQALLAGVIEYYLENHRELLPA